ncbi:MAG: hypothetical protein GY861_16920, partial [bacterium]|nr:hypothetical protein [bacterium]
MASLDVESLFTKVPVEETIDIVKRRLEEMRQNQEENRKLEEITSMSNLAIITLLRFVTKDFYFLWSGSLYRQKQGLPMGNRLSPILANIFMEAFEISVLSKLPVPLIYYTRFVDDLFVIYNEEMTELEELLAQFNREHPQIRLTCEEDENLELPYLDLRVHGNRRRLTVSIYRKPTHSHKYLHYKSSNPLTQQKHGLRGLWLQAQRLLRHNPEELQAELKYLLRTFTNADNGYPRRLVQNWMNNFNRELRANPRLLQFRRDRQELRQEQQENEQEGTEDQEADSELENGENNKKRILSIPYVPELSDQLARIGRRYELVPWFSFKGQIGDELSGSYKDTMHISKRRYAVYKAFCSCGAQYIGETGQNLKVRICEHKKRDSPSALSVH